MTRGFPVGKFGRRNPKRKGVLERNIPLIGRLIEAAHPLDLKATGGQKAAERLAGGDEKAANYLLKRLPIPMATLEAERCYSVGRMACKGCPVIHLCENSRAKHAEPPNPKAPAVIELFCGAGGLSLGFENAGFQVKLAVDADIDAIHTYRANRPWMKSNEAVCEDIRKLMADGTFRKLRGKVDGVIGGPPCQTFSLVGFRTKKIKDRHGRISDDQRTWLPIAMADIIAQVRPKFCVMENVGGFFSALNGNVRAKTEQAIVKAGYSVEELKVHAEDHNTPQKRTRYMLIGLSNQEFGKRRAQELLANIKAALEAPAPKHRTVADALSALDGLPEVKAGGGAEFMAREGVMTWNHYARQHNARDLEIYKALKPGETAAELEERQPNTIPYSLKTFHDKYRKLDHGQPSPTIPAHLKKDANSFVVHGPNRGLTPREAALMQGFPIDYIFIGEQTQQFQQIGNAVPPPVGKAVGTLLMEAMARAQDKKWKTKFFASRGRMPTRECTMVRHKLHADNDAGKLHPVEHYVEWGWRALASTKDQVKPLIYREHRRIRRQGS